MHRFFWKYPNERNNSLTFLYFFRIKTNGSLPRDKRQPSPSPPVNNSNNPNNHNTTASSPFLPASEADLERVFNFDPASRSTEGTINICYSRFLARLRKCDLHLKCIAINQSKSRAINSRSQLIQFLFSLLLSLWKSIQERPSECVAAIPCGSSSPSDSVNGQKMNLHFSKTNFFPEGIAGDGHKPC